MIVIGNLNANIITRTYENIILGTTITVVKVKSLWPSTVFSLAVHYSNIVYHEISWELTGYFYVYDYIASEVEVAV